MLPSSQVLDDHDLEAGHDGGRRVGAVGGLGDEADVAVALRSAWCQARMTSRPAYSPCEPALGCSDGGEAGDLGEPLSEIPEDLGRSRLA